MIEPPPQLLLAYIRFLDWVYKRREREKLLNLKKETPPLSKLEDHPRINQSELWENLILSLFVLFGS